MGRLQLEQGRTRLEVDAGDGARWTSLSVDGMELLTAVELPGAYPPTLSGCFPMAPFAGRLHQACLEWAGTQRRLPVHAPPHAIHGTALDARWTVLTSTASTAVLEADLYDPWPFEGTVRVELAVHHDGLDAALVLEAREEMPVVLGWHPWFRRRLTSGEPVVVHVAPVEQYERGPDALPTGRLVPPTPGPHDDCFLGMRAAPRLEWPGALELTLTGADHWVLFDEHSDAVCVEPQTGPPDAVRLGRAAVVPPGGTLGLTMTLRWRRAAGD